MYRLLTIPFSHYNDKARWGLEHFGLSYREQGFLPGFHVPAVAWATRHRSDAAPDGLSSRFSTPVLLVSKGPRICDSGRILRWLDERHATAASRLFPNEVADRLERQYSEQLGPHTRRVVYSWVIDRPDLMDALAKANTDVLQSALYRAVWPSLRMGMRRHFGLVPDLVSHSQRLILDAVDEAGHQLGRRAYLAGSAFSAADLTLASMLAPVLWVSHREGYGATLPEAERLGANAIDFIKQIRDSKAGRHALKMFRKRGERLAVRH